MLTIVDGLRRKLRFSLADYKAKLSARLQTVGGSEVPSEVPLAPPLGYIRQPTMVEHIRNMVRSEHLRLAAEAAGAESFEDADDFDIDDDPFPVSSSEVGDDLEPIASLREKEAAGRISAPAVAEPPPIGGSASAPIVGAPAGIPPAV